jgi:NADH pyrophosphatase NudC (nudix superfamily)
MKKRERQQQCDAQTTSNYSPKNSLALTHDTAGNRKETNFRDKRDTWLRLSRLVGIILVNAKAEILLQLRSEGDYLYPNYGTLPRGIVEDGESLEQAILREAKKNWDSVKTVDDKNPFPLKFQVIIHNLRTMN